MYKPNFFHFKISIRPESWIKGKIIVFNASRFIRPPGSLEAVYKLFSIQKIYIMINTNKIAKKDSSNIKRELLRMLYMKPVRMNLS